MILVVTGMHQHPFDRLVRAVDEMCGQGVLNDVFIQTGYSAYEPKHCRWSRSVDYEQFERHMDEAEIIITHGGAGSIAGALERNKPTIAVPRLKRLGEHNNDHQLELVGVLERAGRILAVRELDELLSAVLRARTFKPAPAQGGSRIVELIRDFLNQCRAAK